MPLILDKKEIMSTLRCAAPRMAVAAAVSATVFVAPAIAASSAGEPTTGKITNCKKTVFTDGYKANKVPVSTLYGAEKGKHPASSLLSCKNADAVAKSGAKTVQKSDGNGGATIKVGGVSYTLKKYALAQVDGLYQSGPILAWVGGGVVIYLQGT